MPRKEKFFVQIPIKTFTIKSTLQVSYYKSLKQLIWV